MPIGRRRICGALSTSRVRRLPSSSWSLDGCRMLLPSAHWELFLRCFWFSCALPAALADTSQHLMMHGGPSWAALCPCIFSALRPGRLLHFWPSGNPLVGASSCSNDPHSFSNKTSPLAITSLDPLKPGQTSPTQRHWHFAHSRKCWSSCRTSKRLRRSI